MWSTIEPTVFPDHTHLHFLYLSGYFQKVLLMRTKIHILILVYNFRHEVSSFCIFILRVSFSFIRRLLFYIVQTCCFNFNKAGR